MSFAMMPCPYCGGTVAPADGMYHSCQNCGKRIHIARADLHTFAESVGRDDLVPVIDMVLDDNLPKALSSVEEIIQAEEGGTADSLFIRGAVYAGMGEDGKALADWKTGLEMLETFCDIDAYVCLMSNSISGIIYQKETEFVSFDEIKYIDRIGDILYACTGDSCRMILYSTVFRIYTDKLNAEGIEPDDALFLDIVPGLFRRMIEYNRNPEILKIKIDELLTNFGYDETTYEEDDNFEMHIYYLVKVYIEAYTKEMSCEDLVRIGSYWNDENMHDLAERFELIVSCIENPTILDKLKLMRSGIDESDMDIASAVNDYVKMYLLLDNEHSDVARVLQ